MYDWSLAGSVPRASRNLPRWRMMRARGALGVGPSRVEPEAQRHADRARPGAEQRNRAVDAAAHRDGHATRIRRGREGRSERVRERVDRELVAADRRGFEQGQALERAVE